MKHRSTSRFDRREFLRRTAVGGIGFGMLPLGAEAEEHPSPAPQVRRYATLGRTGLRVSDISFGSSRLGDEPDLVRHALARGINYFDTAESYTDGTAETTLGKALEGHRDKVLIASKTITDDDDSRSEMMRALEGTLKRLRTDHVDIYFNHAVNQVSVVENPEWPEFVSRAREQGKIRFSGISGHGPRLVKCLDAALGDGLVDVVLVALNFGQDPKFYQRFTPGLDYVARQPRLPGVLRRAREQGVGIIAMKTLLGARLNDMRPYERRGATFSQAAFRWVFDTGLADALIVTMKSAAMIDEYLGASGAGAPGPGDQALLERYLGDQGTEQCRYGCDACADACPEGVPISDVLRTRMYDRDYDEPELARSEYALLGAGASACLSCAHRSCASSCPHGLSIDRLTATTHDALSSEEA